MPSKNWNDNVAKLLDVPLVNEDTIEEPPENLKDVDDSSKQKLSQVFKKDRQTDQESLRKTRQKARAIESQNKANNKLIEANKTESQNIAVKSGIFNDKQ